MVKTKETLPRWLWINEENFYLNSEKTAEFFNVSTKTITNWNDKANGGLKKETGWWDVKAIVAWLNGDQEMSDAARKLKAEADLKEEQYQKARFANEIERGLYLAKEEIENEWARRVIEIKTSLTGLSRKIAGQIVDPGVRVEIETLIGQEVYEMLNQYSRTGQYTPEKKVKKEPKTVRKSTKKKAKPVKKRGSK